jgi:uncharacterized protein (DUF362 family)
MSIHDPTEPMVVTEAEPARGLARPGWSRRRWIVAGGAVVATAAAGGAGLLAFDRWRRFGAPADGLVRDHRVAAPPGAPGLVVARGPDPAANVRAVLDRLGGMKHFVKPGDVVLVKPNVAWERTPAQAGNTDPSVVAAVVRACRDAGAKEVVVADCPVNGAERTFALSGIRSAAERAGATVLLPGAAGTQTVSLSPSLGNWPVFAPLLRADKVINVPIAKHHGSSRVTAGMKNWIGITPHERARFHAALDRTIVELAALVRPTLTVLDATRVLMRNGPRGGNLADVRECNAVAASLDPVAIDAWATDLLEAPRSEVEYLELAAQRGLGRLDYRAMGLVEIHS